MAYNPKTIIKDSAGDELLISAGGAAKVEGTIDLGATDNAVLDAIAASVAAIDTDTTTIIGHVDGLEGLIGTTNTNTGNIATAVQLLDDTVTVLGTDTYTEATSKGLTIAAVRRDADTTLVNTTNEYGPLQMDANGRLKVEAFSGETLPVSLTSTTVSGTVAVTQSGTWDEVGINDSGNSITVDNGGTFAVQAAGDVAHGTADSGSPVKIGFKARNAFPTAEANGDRVDASGDLWGRQLVAHIDPAQYISKAFNATTTQTGTDVWSPTSGKKIAITSIVIGTYGTTVARLILWFGANADTTYSAGTDQLILAASFAPSSTVKPGLVFTPASPIFAATADHEIHCTTDAGMSIDIVVHGYEYS